MRNAKRFKPGAALALFLCMAAMSAAQEGPRTVITGVELSASQRGLILTLSGTGPIAVGPMPVDLETTTARYPELSVGIPNVSSGIGAAAIAGPEQLPVREISLADNAEGVTLTVKMRGAVNGPIDVRSSGSLVRILLTRDPQPEMTWTPPPPRQQPAAAAPAQAQPNTRRPDERAARDAPAGGEMFTIKDGPQTSAPRAPQPVAVPSAQPGAAPAAAQSDAIPTAQAVADVPHVSPKTEGATTIYHETESTATVAPRTSGLVRYRTHGRDPFVPLVKDTAATELPRVENLRLVGVLEDYQERIALVEDFKNGNKAFALRANDEVEYGKVLRVQRDRVVFLIRDFDISRSYVLTLSAP